MTKKKVITPVKVKKTKKTRLSRRSDSVKLTGKGKAKSQKLKAKTKK